MGRIQSIPRLLVGIAFVGGLIALLLIALGFVVTLELFHLGEHGTDPGVALATMALALFTGLLFLFGVVTALFAYEEISTSSKANKLSAAANSATLALQMDNRFHSDRALRIRHGAVNFLANHQLDAKGAPRRNLDLHCDCAEEISPYSTDKDHYWHNLPSDLIDLFNYFDWIGYLALKKSETMDVEVVAQKFGPWIINYYQICEGEIEHILANYPARWRYLKRLYNRLTQRESEKWVESGSDNSPSYSGPRRSDDDLNAFLLREHARSHRGVHPRSTVNPQHRSSSSNVADRKPTSTRQSGNNEPRPTEES